MATKTVDYNAEIKKLFLKKGDILVIEKGFNNSIEYWLKTLRDAGKEAGIDFNVPIVFVDSLDGVGVVRFNENG